VNIAATVFRWQSRCRIPPLHFNLSLLGFCLAICQSDMSFDGQQPKIYTCGCLNIRIRPQSPPSPPQVASDPEYTAVYIGEEGITVVSYNNSLSTSISTFSQVHPQVTLRTRSRGVPIYGTSQSTRYTSLTCLLCQRLIYRVRQVVPADIEGKDGPQLPTDEWVEQDIMKSSTGWIEVYSSCLVRHILY
jgi:hypothetical protein